MSGASRRALVACSVVASIIILLYQFWDRDVTSDFEVFQQQPDKPVALVVASQVKDNTTWLDRAFLEWQRHLYVVDDPTAQYTVPVNKGKEAMVYLTHIIDNYPNFSPITIFSHANRVQWHNDDPDHDGQRMLSRLQLPFVQSQGYVNLRCAWSPGCHGTGIPLRKRGEEEKPFHHPAIGTDSGGSASKDFSAAFRHLFPELAATGVKAQTLAATCCAQFAVTASSILQRPKEDYEHYRQWLLDTPIVASGKMMEYFWHLIFGRPFVDCPAASDCYCNVYGLCDLRCESDGQCREQWQMPHLNILPDGTRGTQVVKLNSDDGSAGREPA